jgi:hypothetical protein
MVNVTLEILSDSEISVDYPNLNDGEYANPPSLFIGKFDFAGNENHIIAPGYGPQGRATAMYFKYIKDKSKKYQVESIDLSRVNPHVKIKNKNLVLILVENANKLYEEFSYKEGKFKGQLNKCYNIKNNI